MSLRRGLAGLRQDSRGFTYCFTYLEIWVTALIVGTIAEIVVERWRHARTSGQELVVGLLVAIPALVVHQHSVWRARRRNSEGLCARCGRPIAGKSGIIYMS